MGLLGSITLSAPIPTRTLVLKKFVVDGLRLRLIDTVEMTGDGRVAAFRHYMNHHSTMVNFYEQKQDSLTGTPRYKYTFQDGNADYVCILCPKEEPMQGAHESGE